ncbi:TRAP transporter large permease [Wenzhouxiangella sp. EGI_FJ10305]|uniref:TRAP transporter large permease n=1 Tax=Wenzhouxiangella sp. EGI_FJ10305 TaxID=3243768 RepID=UPI0035DC2C7D
MVFVLVVLALLGMPLFAVLALAALGGYWRAGLDPLLAGMDFVRIGEPPLLVALPLFAFSGVLMARSRVPVRLLELMQSIRGRMSGGLVVLVLVPYSLITAFTGFSGIAILAMGSLLFPALIRDGHPRRSSLGIVTAGSSPGVLLAPSLALILYAVVAEQLLPRTGVSLDSLFLAGLLPACLILAVMGGYAAWLNRGRPRAESMRKPFGRALRDNALELPMPLVVLGGIYSGWLLLVEAAVLAAVWVLITVVLIRRELRLSKLPEIITEAMVLVAAMLVLLGISIASANVMVDAGVPQRLLDWFEPLVNSRLVFLLVLMVPLLAVGMLVGVSSGAVILAPLLIPVGMGFGVDPVHLGVVLVVSLQIGCLTLPAGINVVAANHGSGKDLHTVYRAALPFLGILLAVLLIIAGWPALSMTLPSLLAE